MRLPALLIGDVYRYVLPLPGTAPATLDLEVVGAEATASAAGPATALLRIDYRYASPGETDVGSLWLDGQGLLAKVASTESGFAEHRHVPGLPGTFVGFPDHEWQAQFYSTPLAPVLFLALAGREVPRGSEARVPVHEGAILASAGVDRSGVRLAIRFPQADPSTDAAAPAPLRDLEAEYGPGEALPRRFSSWLVGLMGGAEEVLLEVERGVGALPDGLGDPWLKPPPGARPPGRIPPESASSFPFPLREADAAAGATAAFQGYMARHPEAVLVDARFFDRPADGSLPPLPPPGLSWELVYHPGNPGGNGDVPALHAVVWKAAAGTPAAVLATDDALPWGFPLYAAAELAGPRADLAWLYGAVPGARALHWSVAEDRTFLASAAEAFLTYHADGSLATPLAVLSGQDAQPLWLPR